MKPKAILLIVLMAWVLFGLKYFNLPPFHMKQRATSSYAVCVNNLRQIDAAVNEWAVEHHQTNGGPVTLEDIKLYIKLNMNGEIPGCPDGGKYSVTVVGAPPTCSLGTNTTPRSFTQKVADYIKGKEDSHAGQPQYHRLP